jgi:hypothetical protein
MTLGGGAALAQSSAAAGDARGRFQAAFQEMMADPGNIEKTLRYARTASELDDPEAAIGALERLLLVDRDIARVNLELGELYFRLRSYEVSRRYFLRAQSAADATPETRERAAVFLNEIGRRIEQTNLSGNVTMGLRYQSNANFGPDSPRVRGAGQPVQLPADLTESSDGSAFALVQLRHVYDFDTQDGTAIETDAMLYGARYFSNSQLHLGVAQISTGPRFKPLPDEAPGFSIRPRVLGDVVTLGDRLYSSAGGFGIDVREEYSSALATELGYTVRFKDVRDSGRRPTASELSGTEHTIAGRVRYAVTRDAVLGLDLAYARDETDKEYNNSDRFRIMATASQRYPAPFGLTADQWTTTVFVVHSWYDFDTPDPVIDPGTTRRDREWRIGIGQVVPLSDAWSVLAQVEHIDNDSNLPNYTFTNTSVLVGVSYRF